MFTVELYAGIRRAVMVDGLSRRRLRSDLAFTKLFSGKPLPFFRLRRGALARWMFRTHLGGVTRIRGDFLTPVFWCSDYPRRRFVRVPPCGKVASSRSPFALAFRASGF
jgi:hypothetical protein